jgi:hypothetical protein
MKAGTLLGLVLAAMVLPALVCAQEQTQATNEAVATAPAVRQVPFCYKASADKATNILGLWSCIETNRSKTNSNLTYVTTTSFLFAESYTTSDIFAVNRTIRPKLYMPTVVGLPRVANTSTVHDTTIVVTESSNNTITVTSVPVFRGRVAVTTRSSGYTRSTRHRGTFYIAGNELRIEINKVGEVSGYGPRASLPALNDSYFFGFDGQVLVLTNTMDGRVRLLVRDNLVTQDTHEFGGRPTAVWKTEDGATTNGTSGVRAKP